MLDYKVYENTYWNNKGKYQNFVNESLNDDKIFNNLKITKTLKKEYQNMAHAYYRFYNDGDQPRHYIFKGKNEAETSQQLEIEIDKIIEKIMSLVK